MVYNGQAMDHLKTEDGIGKHGLILYDGECEFCLFWIQFILKRSAGSYFRYASLQSELARALFPDSKKMRSLLFYEKNILFDKSTAVIKIAKHLRWPWKALGLLSAVPAPIRNFIYDWIAKHRYKLPFKSSSPINPADKKQCFLE